MSNECSVTVQTPEAKRAVLQNEPGGHCGCSTGTWGRSLCGLADMEILEHQKGVVLLCDTGEGRAVGVKE